MDGSTIPYYVVEERKKLNRCIEELSLIHIYPNESFLTINAVDGSIIDRDLGY